MSAFILLSRNRSLFHASGDILDVFFLFHTSEAILDEAILYDCQMQDMKLLDESSLIR